MDTREGVNPCSEILWIPIVLGMKKAPELRNLEKHYSQPSRGSLAGNLNSSLPSVSSLLQWLPQSIAKSRTTIGSLRFTSSREQEIRALQRKTAPFLQAVNDKHYVSYHERRGMIMESIFRDKSEHWKKAFHHVYLMNQPW